MPIDLHRAFAEEPAPLDFLLPGLLAGTVGAIVSPGGAGKSMLALELAILVATGHDMSGFNAGNQYQTGPVAFLAAEDPEAALLHRLYGLGKHLSKQLRDQIAGQVFIEPMLGEAPDLTEPKWLERIEGLAVGKRLVILDTLRRFHSLDENSSGEMAQLLSLIEGIAKRTGATVLFLHHASKSAAMNGQGDMQQASRGSSVLVDNIRWQMYLASCTPEEAAKYSIDDDCRGSFVRAGISKQNYGKPFVEQWMRRVDGGVLVPAVMGKPAAHNRRATDKTKEEW